MSMNACCRRHGEKEGRLVRKEGDRGMVSRTLLHTLGCVVAVGVVVWTRFFDFLLAFCLLFGWGVWFGLLGVWFGGLVRFGGWPSGWPLLLQSAPLTFLLLLALMNMALWQMCFIMKETTSDEAETEIFNIPRKNQACRRTILRIRKQIKGQGIRGRGRRGGGGGRRGGGRRGVRHPNQVINLCTTVIVGNPVTLTRHK